MITRILATIAAVFIAVGPSLASHCAQPARVLQKQQYNAYQVQGQYQAQAVHNGYYRPYEYYVGEDLRLEAVAEKIARKVEEKLQERGTLQAAEPPLGLTVLTQKCAVCHKPGTRAVLEKDAPVFFDAKGQLKPLKEAQALKMAMAADMGQMPPPPAKELSKRQAAAIEEYLFPDGLPDEEAEGAGADEPAKADK